MLLTVRQAAAATGKSKPTILRAIRSGKISAVKDEATGHLRVDPAELHRVFPPKSHEQERPEAKTLGDTADDAVVLRRELAILTTEREREREQYEAQLDDLRRRLDTEGEERRRLTAILTDQRAKPAPEAIPMPPPATAPQPIITPAPPAAAPAAVEAPSQTVEAVPASERSWLRRMLGGR